VLIPLFAAIEPTGVVTVYAAVTGGLPSDWSRTGVLKALMIGLTVVAGLVGALLYGACRWHTGTRALRARLDAARAPVRPQAVEFRELNGLPAAVQRYFRAVRG
jgi:hypothetical protein